MLQSQRHAHVHSYCSAKFNKTEKIKVEHEQRDSTLSFDLYFIKLQDKSLVRVKDVLIKCLL